jgi:hypothetical protein
LSILQYELSIAQLHASLVVIMQILSKFAARMDPTRLPHKFLTAWVSHPRRSGGQHYTLQNSYVKTLQHILPNIPDNGTIDSWLPLAQNREQWKSNTRD